ncbi:MAG: helix-hairpin-helix domain-containing protein [Anaerolineales bacterium]
MRTYDLELERAASQAVWAFRKAAWAVDELPSRVDDLYRIQGRTGIESVPGIAPQAAEFAAAWLQAQSPDDPSSRL